LAFIVEEGAGLPDSNAYASVAFVDTYHTDRGNTKWTGTQAVKEACIIRATDYIEKRFGTRFRGNKRTRDQNLEWPRLSAWDNDDFLFDNIDIIPRRLKQACAEYALRALLVGELAPDVPPATPRQNNISGSVVSSDVVTGVIKMTRKKIDTLETETQYGNQFSYSGRSGVSSIVSASSIPEYPAADLLLVELLKGLSSGSISRG
jgi:hypothetical protein